MRTLKKISMDRIFAKVYNDFGLEDVEESNIVEWTGDVLGHLEIPGNFEERVAFLEVKNHQVELPDDLINILRIARNNRWDPDPNVSCRLGQVELEELGCPNPEVELIDGTCEVKQCYNNLPILLNCRGELTTPYGVAHYRPNFKIDHDAYVWANSDLFKERFTYVRPSSNAYKSAVLQESSRDEREKIYHSTTDEYSLINGTHARFNFKEGQVAISYIAQPLDIETGYPLVPDDVSVLNAITNYILFMYCRKMHIIGRDGYKEKYKDAEVDYQWYLSQAKNKIYGLYGVEDFQKFAESRYSFIPNVYKYNQHRAYSRGYRSAQQDINNINRSNG